MSQTKAQLISDLVQALNFTGTSSHPANGMYLSAANTISLSTNSTAGRLTIDSSGNATFSGDVNLADDKKIQLGATPDFKIYHDSSSGQSIIEEVGPSVLKIKASDFRLSNADNSADYIQANDGAAVKLFHNGGAAKFETTSSGVTVTDTCTATTFIGALTGTASGNPTLAAGSDNRLITATGANTLTGETALTFDGNALRVGGATHGSHSTFSDIFLGGAAHLYAETTGAAGNSLSISQNAHVDSDGSWEYIVTDEASNIYQYSGKIGFRTAASGTAGNDISWEERLLITATGEILIGRSAKPNDINKLVITGTSPADEYDSTLYLEGNETSGAANTGGALAFGGHDNTAFRNWGNIYGMKENGTGGNTASYMSFHTRANGGNPVEKLRIDSTGHLYIKGQNHEVRWYRDDEARYGAVTYDGSNFNIHNPVNDHTRVCKSDGTELVKFHNGGDVLIADGDLVISTAGHGIDFSAQTGTSATGATTGDEVLDHYEEGTWTPANQYLTITNNNTATYTRIGRVVTIQFDCTYAASPADTSQVGGRIEGLPFAGQANGYHFTPTWLNAAGDDVGDNGEYNFLSYVNGSDSKIIFYSIGNNCEAIRAQTAGKRVRGTVTYHV